jgi:2-polyprenyl-6-methoxyphenol hydroxylase-like FAD-dependent oxidoreductase
MRLDDLVDADVIVVGAGLAGLAAAAELARAGRRVLLLDQEPESNLGGPRNAQLPNRGGPAFSGRQAGRAAARLTAS